MDLDSENVKPQPQFLETIHRISTVFPKYTEDTPFCLKPKQVQCFDHLLQGHDVIAILPTGYGKSSIFHMLPDVLPTKSESNIILIIAPLNSIIEDQVKSLRQKGITSGTLNTEGQKEKHEVLFEINKTVNQQAAISKEVRSGSIKLLYGHPESFLNEQGRALLKSDVYQQNVVACVIDEAHCIEMWGKEFRTDFGNLSALRSIFPSAVMIALTATAPLMKIEELKSTLCFAKDCKIIRGNPNRNNILLRKMLRQGNHTGIEGYKKILVPIAEELKENRENYPMTVIYMKLQYCYHAYNIFEAVLGKEQYIGNDKIPTSRLFCQFHAPQTPQMKKEILQEITKTNSNIRVIMATTALGMGVNTPYVINVIHIGPPSNVESYLQEFGRAGRNGQEAVGTLYYNNSDISNNKVHIDVSMKNYCKETNCLRNYILNYFGFPKGKQSRCCSNCEEDFLIEKENTIESKQCRTVATENLSILKEELESSMKEWKESLVSNFMNLFEKPKIDDNLVNDLMENISTIESEKDLLFVFGINNEEIAKEMFQQICKFST